MSNVVEAFEKKNTINQENCFWSDLNSGLKK